jgi:hypothetical protein
MNHAENPTTALNGQLFSWRSQSALVLAAACLRPIAGTKWGTGRYLDMELLKKQMLQDQIGD